MAQPQMQPAAAVQVGGGQVGRVQRLAVERRGLHVLRGRVAVDAVHSALTWQFGTGPGGLPGNDDSGGLSSWYVWASLGLFPVAGQHLFLINAPAFERAVIQAGDGEFVVETSGHRDTPIGVDGLEHDPPPQYVQSATLNGVPLHAAHLSAADLHRGGRLHLRLGREPSTWGSGIRPPSLP